jgi:putative membrane protein
MADRVTRLFPEADRARIQAAVEAAELRTSGEIVPYIVERSDHYEEAEWRAGALAAVLTLGGVGAYLWFSDSWLPFDTFLLSLDFSVAFLGGFVLARFVPAVKRVLAGPALVERRVSARAAEAFLSEEVFATTGRTGILFFVSLLEHRVVVLGDTGINAKVKKEEWEAVVQTVIEGIKEGRPTDGIVSAIGQAGGLLERTGVRRLADDRDELPDTQTIRE